MSYLQSAAQAPKRHKPTSPYCGLTIILSNPSRFDTMSLLSANGGQLVLDALWPLKRQQCDIRLYTETEPLLPDTRCCLIFGEHAMHAWSAETRTNTLNEQRGSLIYVNDTAAVATYNPQESVDMQDYEKQRNVYLKERAQQEDISEDDLKSEVNEKRRHGQTSPANWKFWLEMDVKKAVRIVQNPSVVTDDIEPEYVIYPSSQEVIDVLTRTQEHDLLLDIETDSDNNILCLAFAFDLNRIYVVPFLTHEYQKAYTNLEHIYRAFGIALQRNTAVAHNGAGFDFIQLARNYRLAVGRSVYDTMLAQHRCHPKVEKSLGHCVSLWTYERFHKDESDFSYRTSMAAERLYRYCGKDVFSMGLVKRAIDRQAARIPGLADSIAQVNASIKPYVTMMLQGMRIDVDEICKRIDERSKEATQLMRVIKCLIGPKVAHLISNQKCVHYFHDCLGYEIQGWTKANNPSMDRKSLLKLKLWAMREFEGKQPNPVIDLLIKYRETAKEASMLAFNHYMPDADGDARTTTAIQLSGTYTFRLASKKFALSMHKDDKVGGNLQNWEADTRQCAIADDGKCFVGPDQAGAEALIVAYLCEPGAYRQIFENNIKIHCFIALHAFPRVWAKHFGAKNITQALACTPADLVKLSFWPDLNKMIKQSDDNKAAERYYFIGKMICHSTGYGAKWPTFQLNVLDKSRGALAFTAKESRAFIDLYHSLFPEIRRWHERVRYQVTQTGYLYNLFGYPCHFFDNKHTDKEKDWFAFVPQSTVGTITNIAATKFYDYAAANDKPWDIMVNTHDGLLTQVPEGDKEEAGYKLVECITPSFKSPLDGTPFKMKAEVKWGYNWGNRKELPDGSVVNERGLRELKL